MKTGRFTYLLLVVVLLLSMLSACQLYKNSRWVYAIDGADGEIDKNAVIARLDTAAVDDWEGLWLFLGPKEHCYLIIERLNDFSHQAYYTHSIRLWNKAYLDGFFELLPGTLVGFLEQGLYDEVKRITLREGFLVVNEEVSTTVQLDKSRRHMIFDRSVFKRYDYEHRGMVRIYPIRSVDEQEYKVRYL